MMILGIRPTIGTFLYFVLGRSWLRFGTILAVFAFIAYNLLEHSKVSLHLHFSKPAPYPPPIVILSNPTNEYLTPFDACAVEAATRVEKSRLDDEQLGDLLKRKRNVILYRWTSNVSPLDTWTQFVSKLDGIKVFRMDIKKAFMGTPIDNMVAYGGWAGHSEQVIWAAVGLSLLWDFGGILIPTGVLMSSSQTLLNLNVNSQNFLIAMEGTIVPLAMGIQEHHPLMLNMFKQIQNKTYEISENIPDGQKGKKLFPPSFIKIMTKAAMEVCKTSDVTDLIAGSCSNFKIFSEDTLIDLDIGTDSTILARLMEDPQDEDGIAFVFKSSNSSESLEKAMGLFHRYPLKRFCPRVYMRLHKQMNKHL